MENERGLGSKLHRNRYSCKSHTQEVAKEAVAEIAKIEKDCGNYLFPEFSFSGWSDAEIVPL